LETPAKIRHFLLENILAGMRAVSFTDDDSFLENGIIDSTGILELIGFIEQEFGVDVRDEDLVPRNFDSISGLCRYIAERNGNAAAAGDDATDAPSRPLTGHHAAP
jgi:acyl carrier protein